MGFVARMRERGALVRHRIICGEARYTPLQLSNVIVYIAVSILTSQHESPGLLSKLCGPVLLGIDSATTSRKVE
jgi:hypothetical protein